MFLHDHVICLSEYSIYICIKNDILLIYPRNQIKDIKICSYDNILSGIQLKTSIFTIL